MPLRDRSGQRWQPSGKPYVAAAAEAIFGSIGTRRYLRCTRSTYLSNKVCLGFLMRFRAHWFSSPPFVSLFILFPLHTHTHTLCFLFSFMSSCLHVLSSHPFFFCAHIGPGLSVYVHFYIHLQPRFQVAQVLIMRWDSSVVPVHLVPLSSQLRTFPSCLVFSSCLHLFVFAARACAHLPLP